MNPLNNKEQKRLELRKELLRMKKEDRISLYKDLMWAHEHRQELDYTHFTINGPSYLGTWSKLNYPRRELTECIINFVDAKPLTRIVRTENTDEVHNMRIIETTVNHGYHGPSALNLLHKFKDVMVEDNDDIEDIILNIPNSTFYKIEYKYKYYHPCQLSSRYKSGIKYVREFKKFKDVESTVREVEEENGKLIIDGIELTILEEHLVDNLKEVPWVSRENGDEDDHVQNLFECALLCFIECWCCYKDLYNKEVVVYELKVFRESKQKT